MDLNVEITYPNLLDSAGTVKRAVRKRAGVWVRNTVHIRTQAGMGASGPLPGYSDRPLAMAPNAQRTKKIVTSGAGLRSKGKFFPGGYKQYKKKTGQESGRFTFTNRGHFWRDWKVLKDGGTDGNIEIGVSRNENAEALWKTFEDQPKRYDMLKFNYKEMSELGDDILDAVLQQIKKDLAKKSKVKV